MFYYSGYEWKVRDGTVVRKLIFIQGWFLEQWGYNKGFTAQNPLQMATQPFKLRKRSQSFPQQCYLQCLHAVSYLFNTSFNICDIQTYSVATQFYPCQLSNLLHTSRRYPVFHDRSNHASNSVNQVFLCSMDFKIYRHHDWVYALFLQNKIRIGWIHVIDCQFGFLQLLDSSIQLLNNIKMALTEKSVTEHFTHLFAMKSLLQQIKKYVTITNQLQLQ